MSREDIKTLNKIMKVCYADMKKAFAAPTNVAELTELERTHLTVLV